MLYHEIKWVNDFLKILVPKKTFRVILYILYSTVSLSLRRVSQNIIVKNLRRRTFLTSNHSTMHTVQYSTIQYIQYSSVQCITKNTVQHTTSFSIDTIQRSSLQCISTRPQWMCTGNCTALYCTVLHCDVL